jgi:hypothetical protein
VNSNRSILQDHYNLQFKTGTLPNTIEPVVKSQARIKIKNMEAKVFENQKTQSALSFIFGSVFTLALFLSSCLSSSPEPQAATPAAQRAEQPQETSPTAEADMEEATITAVLEQVLPDTRELLLKEPVENFDRVALAPDSLLLDMDGNPLELTQLGTGDKVNASGHSGSPGVLIADRIQVTEYSPTTLASTTSKWVGDSHYDFEDDPLSFQLIYDKDVWRLFPELLNEYTDQLEHQTLVGCLIRQTSGRGLDDNWSVERDITTLGEIEYERTWVYEDANLRYINYSNQMGDYANLFQVRWSNDARACINSAEEVLSTLEIIIEN